MNLVRRVPAYAGNVGAAGPAVPARILQLVTNGPERAAIEAGEVDAVLDPASGDILLLPDAQQALQDEQSRMQRLLALATDAVWTQDKEFRFVTYEGTTPGRPPPPIAGPIGRRLWDLAFDNLRSDDWDSHRRQLGCRVAFRDLELRGRDAADQPSWVSVSGEPIYDADDRFAGYFGSLRDITQRKRMEAMREWAHAGRAAIGLLPAPPPRVPLPEGAPRWPIANRLLAALPPDDYRKLEPDLQPVMLAANQVLHEFGASIDFVYFPGDGLVSLRACAVGQTRALEVGIVGSEGVVGLAVAIGVERSAVRAIVLQGGPAMRMPALQFARAVSESAALQHALLSMSCDKLLYSQRVAACCLSHLIHARLAGWLLSVADRLHASEFSLTQILLADTLGVRRESISAAASALQQKQLISFHRGRIRIRNRSGLEAISCGCNAGTGSAR